MKLFLPAIAMILTLTSCGSNKPSASAKDIATNSVGILFTVDGITVYRFGDGSHYHYFAVQTGRPDTVTLSSWTEACGKNCSEDVYEAIQVLVAR